MVKRDVVQRFAFDSGQHCALQLPALQAFFHQRVCAQHQAARCIHQGIDEGRIQVECLVGGDSPGSSRPDDGKSFFIQLGQAESLGQLLRFGA